MAGVHLQTVTLEAVVGEGGTGEVNRMAHLRLAEEVEVEDAGIEMSPAFLLPDENLRQEGLAAVEAQDVVREIRGHVALLAETQDTTDGIP